MEAKVQMVIKLPHLTKSKYLSGLRCERKLWFDVYDHGPYVDPSPGSAMDIGNRVGRGAHTLFPGGVEIDEPPWEHGAAVDRTERPAASPRHQANRVAEARAPGFCAPATPGGRGAGIVCSQGLVGSITPRNDSSPTLRFEVSRRGQKKR